MNGYIAFYRGKRIEVYAATSLLAQMQAATVFKAKKAYEVTVMIAERDTDGTNPGIPVIHKAVD